MLPAEARNLPLSPVRLYGPLCMAIDVVRYNVDLPPLNVGDVLALHPVGAYNVTQSMQFITYRPAVVLIDGKGRPASSAAARCWKTSMARNACRMP